MPASTSRFGLVFRTGLFAAFAGGEPAPPLFAGRLTFRRSEKVLQRDVEEGATRLREDVVAVHDLARDVNPTAALALDPGLDKQLRIDRHRTAEVDEEPARDGREAVPGGEQTARFVERSSDEPTVHEPRRGLVPLVELEIGLVLGQPLALGLAQVDSERVVAAAPTGRIVVRRHPRLRALPHGCPPSRLGGAKAPLPERYRRWLRTVARVGNKFVPNQRSPPRSLWALKNSWEPAVAIAAEAEISNASVAAATIWAKR